MSDSAPGFATSWLEPTKPARREKAERRPTAIIFDLDNTLVHSQIDFRAIRQDLGTLLHSSGAVAERVALEGLGRRSIGQLIELGVAHDARHSTTLANEMWRIVEGYEAAGMALATIDSDAATTLAELRRRGHALGVLTNNAHAAAIAALEQFALLEYFDPILGREQAIEMKPSGRGLEVAQAYLGPRAPQLVMVGDSYLDALAARAVAAPFIAFRPRPGDLEAHGVEAQAVVHQLSELLALRML